MKPVRLVARIASEQRQAGWASVMDPFGRLVHPHWPLHALGLKARLLELDPRFVDVIGWRCRRRGGIATLEGGESFAALMAERGVGTHDRHRWNRVAVPRSARCSGTLVGRSRYLVY